MSTLISLRSKDQLEGTSNFNTWKDRILSILEEHDLDGYVSNVVEEPTSNAGHTNYKRNQSKYKCIIYDFVKDKLMSVFTPFKTTKECFDILTNLYEKKTTSQKRELNKKLLSLKIEKDDTVASFFKNIS